MLDLEFLLQSLDTDLDRHDVFLQLGETGAAANHLLSSHRRLPLLGSMGMVIPVSLGYALSSGSSVLAIEGDGGLLMNLGCLTTLSRHSSADLKIVVIDNGVYASTGKQVTNLAFTRGLTEVALACGLVNVRRYSSPENVGEMVSWINSPGLKMCICSAGILNRKFDPIDIDPSVAVDKFRFKEFD